MAILGFREILVEDVMIPRADVIGVDMNTTLAELLELFETSGHSRMPVYKESLDDIIGFIHVKDALRRITEVVSPPAWALASLPASMVMACLGIRYWGRTARRSDTVRSCWGEGADYSGRGQGSHLRMGRPQWPGHAGAAPRSAQRVGYPASSMAERMASCSSVNAKFMRFPEICQSR